VKKIGFPGAGYDYRDFVEKHGQRFPLPPVALSGQPAGIQRAVESKEPKEFARPQNRDSSVGARRTGPCSKI